MQTLNETTEKLYNMFTENTGVHFLDSGGSSGRAWQRNQAIPKAEFLARPDCWLSYWSESEAYPVVNSFNFLNENLTYSPSMDAAFNEFAKTMPNDYWDDVVMAWVESLGINTDKPEFYSDYTGSFYTYNCPDNHLGDQNYIFTIFKVDGVSYVVLQIHGGADARGGFTKPAIFELSDYADEYLIAESYNFFCESPECNFRVYGYGSNTPEIDGVNETANIENWQLGQPCPNCGGKLG